MGVDRIQGVPRSMGEMFDSALRHLNYNGGYEQLELFYIVLISLKMSNDDVAGEAYKRTAFVIECFQLTRPPEIRILQ